MSTAPYANPDTDYGTALKNYENYIQQIKQVRDDLYGGDGIVGALEKLKKALKSGHQESALMIAETLVLPLLSQLQGTQLGKLGATMNIGSAFQEAVSDAQHDLNGTSDPKNPISNNPLTPEQSKDLLTQLQWLWGKLTDGHGNYKNPGDWMDPSTGKSIYNAIKNFCGMFMQADKTPCTDPNQLSQPLINGESFNSILNNIKTEAASGDQGPALSDMRQMNADFTQMTNALSTKSQGLNSQLQYASQLYNQFLNTVQGSLKDLQTLTSAIQRAFISQ